MRKNHYDELDPEYVIDEGGFGSRDMFAAGKLVFGISVAEKKIMWLRLRAGGRGRSRLAAARAEPQRSPDRARSHRLFGEPMAAAPFQRHRDDEAAHRRPLAANKFNNAIQKSTISLTSLRSGVGDPPKVNVIPSVAEATLDCRVLPGTTAAQWIEERRAAARGSDRSRSRSSTRGRIRSSRPQDTPLYRALESAIKRHHPDAIVTPMTVPYGTDANGFRAARREELRHSSPASFPPPRSSRCTATPSSCRSTRSGPAIQILFEALVETTTAVSGPVTGRTT